MKRLSHLAALTASAVLLTSCAGMRSDPPTCPDDAAISTMSSLYGTTQAMANPAPGLTMEAARCGRDKFARSLVADYGPVVGYKAGLTNEAVQKRFNYPAPMWGSLNQKMILRSGASVPATFGARPVFEADMVAVVKSSAIHDAKTPLEVLSQLSTLYPFIEMPDLRMQDPAKIDGPALQLINVAARYGVLGSAIPFQADAATVTALREMTVRLIDGDGKELAAGKGSGILDNPLNAVIWLAADLKKSGITLKEGDLLSLGSFTPLLPPKAGQTVTAVYEGLPGTPKVSVSFK